MEGLDYQSFLAEIVKGMPQKSIKRATEALLGVIIDREDVANKSNNPYVVTDQSALKWKNNNAVPPGIKRGAGINEVISGIGDYYEENLLSNKVISALNEQDVADNIAKLLTDDKNISDDRKNELLELYDSGVIGEFLGQTFLYVITSDTQVSKTDVINKSPIEEIIDLLEKNAKPLPLSPPEEISDIEIPYTTELISIYSEEIGEEIKDVLQLKQHSKYKEHFERQRRDFFSAETIRQSTRDTFMIHERPAFEMVKDETYDGIIGLFDDTYETNYKRMTTVLNNATHITLSSNLNIVSFGWIGASEKKGVCHMLVNEGRISWVGDNE